MNAVSNFFIMENLTFVLFEPNSWLKWQYNLNGIDPYEYFEGNMMRRYIFDWILNGKNLYSIYLGMIGGILRDHKYFQFLETYDKIDEITEEISDINKFEQNSRLFWLKSSIDPDFHVDVVPPHKSSLLYYSYLINMKDFEIRKKRIFFKAFNIGINDEKELSVNSVLNVYLWSNETLRASLVLNDLHEKAKIPSVNHMINFTKDAVVNGSKLYSELVRFKEFIFVIQIEHATLETIINTVFRVSLFWMVINK